MTLLTNFSGSVFSFMKHVRKSIFRLAFPSILCALVAVFPHHIAVSSPDPPPSDKHPPSASRDLTPAQNYSGELLAYLMKVVLGRAGDPKLRKDWQTRGIDEDLDFNHIVKVMTNPEKNQLDFMVLDPNILDLSQVLYYYDEKLSLFKGEYGVTGIYPAPEILAIRLFLLKKIRSGEKIDLDAFMRRKKNLLNGDYQPSPEDLAATRLTAGEMKFLRDIFKKKPNVYNYLTCPSLLKAIAETGVLASGDLVAEIIQSTNPLPYQCNSNGRFEEQNAVKIAVLTSMTKEFHYGWPHGSLSEHGFKPTDFLKGIFNKLKKDILEATQKRLNEKISKPPYPKLTKSQWRKAWGHLSKQDIIFCTESQKPFVIYPENASQVIGEVCPKADFTIILLGKNTYRAIYFDPAEDAYAARNRLYLDIMDVEYDQAGEEMEKISRFICLRLRNRLSEVIRSADK